ncbi:hypothetical protein [Streptomyces xanthophaeus]
MPDQADPAGHDRFKDINGPQDPLVDALRPTPSEPPVAGLTLKGLLGDSDRPGHRRLYFTAKLDHFAEFATEDVASVSRIPPDRLPFRDEEATKITFKKGAEIEYTRSHSVRYPDEFDLDIRRIPGRSRTYENSTQTGYYTDCCNSSETCPEEQWSDSWTCTCYLTCGETCSTCGELTCRGEGRGCYTDDPDPIPNPTDVPTFCVGTC